VRTVETQGGVRVPAIGQGTWAMGDRKDAHAAEVAALRLGLDLGMTLIDTAEMYADGRAEEIVAEAIAGRRDEVFLVTKVLPQNASARGTLAAAERSLARLRTDRIDLYLLHWEGPHPLADTFGAFEKLRASGKIRAFGVSNFDLDFMKEAWRLPTGDSVAANQVLYNLSRRSIEWSLLDECARRGVLIMAYSPLEQGRLGFSDELSEVARRHDATPAQVALAWTVRRPGVVAIPKASGLAHVRENAGAAALRLAEADLALLDSRYPPPRRAEPLDTL
jgi:diketogulonate reductase-like aldo/keto reductase